MAHTGKLIFVLIAILLLPGQDKTSISAPNVTLKSVFNPPGCSRACWLGIEPGIATQKDVQNILSAQGIVYQVKDELGLGMNPTDNPYGWMPDNRFPYIDNAQGQREVRIFFTEGVVQGITLPVNIPLSSILSEYGAPIQVRHLESTMFELIYPSMGMNFFVSQRDGTDHAITLTLFSPLAALQNVEPADSPTLLDNCSLFHNPCTIATATPALIVPSLHGSIVAIDWSAEVKLAVGNSVGTINIINTSGQTIKTIPVDDLMTIAWNPDGTKLAYADHYNDIWIWDAATDTTIRLTSPGEFTRTLVWNPDGTQLAVGATNNTGPSAESEILIWDVHSLQLVKTVEIEWYAYVINAMDWNPASANQIALGSVDGDVLIWDIQTNKQLNSFSVAEGMIATSLTWSRSGHYVAVGSDDGNVWIWNTVTRQLSTLNVPPSISDVRWSGDNLLAVATGNTIAILDPTIPAILEVINTDYDATRIAWSPDNTQIVYGGLDGDYHVLSLADYGAAPSVTGSPTATAQP
jgi:WD40 repeat protein